MKRYLRDTYTRKYLFYKETNDVTPRYKRWNKIIDFDICIYIAFVIKKANYVNYGMKTELILLNMIIWRYIEKKC